MVAKPRVGQLGTYLQVRNRASSSRIVVADPRAAEGSGDTEPFHRDLHGRAFHWAAVVGVQREWAGEAFLGPDRTFQDLGRKLGGLAVVNLPADDLAAEDADDEVEVEERPADRARQPCDIPAPAARQRMFTCARVRPDKGLLPQSWWVVSIWLPVLVSRRARPRRWFWPRSRNTL